MKRTEIIHLGVKIDEVYLQNNGIYAATKEFYVVNDELYSIITYNNDLNYNGKNITEFIGNIKDMSFDYACIQNRLSEDGFFKLRQCSKLK